LLSSIDRFASVADYLSLIQLNNAIGHIVVTIVMADHDDGFPGAIQRGQKIEIEFSPELGILVGGPFIE